MTFLNIRGFAAFCTAIAVMVGLGAAPALACYGGSYCNTTPPPSEPTESWESRDGFRLDARGAAATYLDALAATTGAGDRQFGATESIADEVLNYGARARSSVDDAENCLDCGDNRVEIFVDYLGTAANRAVHAAEGDDGESVSRATSHTAGGFNTRMEAIRSRLQAR